jgi:rhamnosyltransferase
MREDLFIDHVDTEWCHRARAADLHLFGVGNARLEHRLGEGSFRVWYMRWRRFNDCSPQRMYYRVRNFLFLCGQSYVPFRWKIRASWNWIGNVYAYGMCSPQRWQHLRWMTKGALDALRGRLGHV